MVRPILTDTLCAGCNGSGEGQYDGSKCPWCDGHGVEHDREAEAEAEAERADYEYQQRKDAQAIGDDE